MVIASAIATNLISTILPPMAAKAMEKVTAVVVDKVDGIVNIKRDIAELQNTLRMVDAIVQLAEGEQIENDFIPDLLRDLVDIGYEARDVLDDFITFSSCINTAEEASKPVNTIASFMLSYVGGSSSDTSIIPLTYLNRLAKDIRSVKERFDKDIEKCKKFAIIRKVVVGGGGSKSVPEDRRAIVGPSTNKQGDILFLVREKVKEEIMEKILHPSDDNVVHVVAIWGMGGIGKTTLARSIYNDIKVKKLPRRWLSVGVKNFNAMKVIREIVNDQNNNTDIETLEEELKKKLRGAKQHIERGAKQHIGRRFLIVLDDVWDVDGSEWRLLLDSLAKVGKGGLIIITKREKEVCPELTKNQTAYNLQLLSEQDSWSLFESCAYKDGKSDSTQDLKVIGKEIVENLNGLPLALRVVGCSLLVEDFNTWKNFLMSNKWKLIKDKEVMSVLRWSYNHLPRHLKTCFTYCALFPKGHEFDKKVLVEMWMAQDLIQNEDVGAQYFEELVNASLLQCVDGKYVMHDMIRDLALHVSNEEFSSAVGGSLSTGQMKNVRHITIIDHEYSKNLSLCKSKRILTVYTPYKWSKRRTTPLETNILLEVFEQSKSLRVLVLSHPYIHEIPDCISELKHLRYLDVSQTCVRNLPERLCLLYHLQMLAAPLNAVLPRDIVNMVNLRYVRANLSTCKGVGKLTSLQELSSIHVCEGDNIKELGHMQEIRGKLTIEGLQNVTSSEDAAGALMQKQTLMNELILKFGKEFAEPTISEEVLDALGCPPKLTYLEISGYTGVKPPSWMVDGKLKFHKLETLNMTNCPKLEYLPPLGELISLKCLYLENVGVKRLGGEFYGKFTDDKVFFPSLESLSFICMEEWEGWNDIIENSNISFFPCLTSLEIDECPKLVSVLPVVKITDANNFCKLKRLQICGCKDLKSLPVDFHKLSSIKTLCITSCPQLQSLPADGIPPSLRYLSIQSSPLL